MFAQVTAETVMSMSAPNPERFDVRVLETEANGLLPATAPAVSSLLASGVSWFAVEDEEEDDEDWDDEDDDDDDEEWDDEDEDDDEDELGWDDEDEDEDDDEEEE